MTKEQFEVTRRLMSALVQYKEAYGANALTNLVINALLKIFGVNRMKAYVIEEISILADEVKIHDQGIL